MNRHNPFQNIFTDCAPESPHQLYINAALHAIGEAHGAFLNDLSEEVAQLVINAATTAAHAALEAAHVADEWSDMAKAKHPAPVWTEHVITGAISVYQAMAWQFQIDRYPQLLDERFSEAYLAELITIIDAMLKFALTAAGAADGWDRIYIETLRQMR